jgi:hypothetical protein
MVRPDSQSRPSNLLLLNQVGKGADIMPRPQDLFSSDLEGNVLYGVG